jgi:hypothetical protein
MSKQEDLFDLIKSEADVPIAGANLRYITHLKSLLVSDDELDLLQPEGLIDINDQVILTSSFLEKMTTDPLGALVDASATPQYYHDIKEWIRKQADSGGSVLSCFRT